MIFFISQYDLVKNLHGYLFSFSMYYFDLCTCLLAILKRKNER